MSLKMYKQRNWELPKPPLVLTLHTVFQTILRYDIVLIQEIRDASETAIYDLLNQVNQ